MASFESCFERVCDAVFGADGAALDYPERVGAGAFVALTARHVKQ